MHIVLRAALEQAVELEYIKKNPCHKAKLPKVYKTEITPLTDQQVHDFLAEAQNDEYYGTILRVILFTGLRDGEALGLTWDCVNFKYGTVVINKQLQCRPQDDGGPQPTPAKNGKSRTLRPAKSVMNLLKIRYTEQVMQSMRAGDAWEAWRNESDIACSPNVSTCTSRRSRRKSAHRTQEHMICATPLLSFPCRTGTMLRRCR